VAGCDNALSPNYQAEEILLANCEKTGKLEVYQGLEF
jgi:hypothetical protein